MRSVHAVFFLLPTFRSATHHTASPVKEPPTAKPERPPASTKMLIKNTSLYSSASSLSSSTASASAGGTTSTATATTINHSAAAFNSATGGLKEPFGSRDSLNDSSPAAIIPAGNVAAYRKSLEKQALDITAGLLPAAAAVGKTEPIKSEPTSTAAAAAAGAAAAIEKPARKLFESKDFRKSMENLDEKSPKGGAVPPVLTKKPLVPVKKSPTVSSVANSIFSGLKSKVGSGKEAAATKQPPAGDNPDGAGGSRMVSGSGQWHQSCV